jgi:hypothetical protein
MAKLRFTVEIAAPRDRVAAFFVPQRMPYWYGADIHAEFEAQGGASEFRNGVKLRITGRAARREVSLTVVVTRYKEGCLLEWQFRDACGVRGLQCWELESTSAGTRVVMRDEYELPGRLGKVADKLLTRHAVARRDRLYLTKLKKLAERA